MAAPPKPPPHAIAPSPEPPPSPARPTPGVLVKGCLDDCDICEPELKQEMALDLARKDLENQLLKKQIDLLEKSQEYRCCPAGEAEPSAPHP